MCNRHPPPLNANTSHAHSNSSCRDAQLTCGCRSFNSNASGGNGHPTNSQRRRRSRHADASRPVLFCVFVAMWARPIPSRQGNPTTMGRTKGGLRRPILEIGSTPMDHRRRWKWPPREHACAYDPLRASAHNQPTEQGRSNAMRREMARQCKASAQGSSDPQDKQCDLDRSDSGTRQPRATHAISSSVIPV